MSPRIPSWTATLTWKAACFIVVMCCSLTIVLGVLVHVEVTRQTVATAREKALGKLAEASARYEAGEAMPPESGIDPDGLPESLRALALTGERGTLVADHNGRPTMWAAAPADGRALATAIDYTQSARTISGLDKAIIGSSVLAIGGTLLVGAFAMTRVTRRLHQTASVARRITQGDLDARVGDPRTKDPARPQDEVATVAGALDTMAATLQAKLLSEQRFTADVAHELRTPLTGLQAASELLPAGRPTQLVQERVRTMRQLTEDLLEISRLDSGSEQVESELQELGALAERVVRAHASGGCGGSGGAGGGGAVTEVVVLRDVYVETDRRRLERVLGNLVANAHKHGRGPVVLTVDGPVVTVRDHGDGYPDYLVAHGPQRFRTEPQAGGKGTGLGLTIAVGQAEVIGGRLRFRNAEEGGAVAVLTLPHPPP
ncbi:two-component sensor histidine kinase [Streptomyces venezuelae]|uniref:histidine kinase n=1 Tax=Streptomyces venezuelae TaxID=54571 RepID=A0A5P2D113_STRVZ|nr:HAMP domain-containing sensor histidine kinase [Streptomyces venezuelae]QES48250.1 two-component sensor histidine kinase [Streptomyces venezuelae]